MRHDPPDSANATLASVRRRGQGYLGYLLWVFMILGFLWAANLIVTLLQRWMEILNNVRIALGFSAPRIGPDWWTVSGVSLLAVIGLSLMLWAYSAYRATWNRRLAGIWGPTLSSRHTRILKLQGAANAKALDLKSAYLTALLASSKFECGQPVSGSLDRNAYCATAANVLREIETDIAHRAVTAGLIVGLNRNQLLDSLTIVVSALELQLHVLTRLGKRPSVRTWIELVKRATASIFLNTWVTRQDALYLNLAIRKAALGIEVASEAAQTTLSDLDLDEILGHSSIPGLSELTRVASFGMTVGASGLRHIANFIEFAANDLLQGVMAGGVLYYHGMALAADCLALDEEHRRSPEMTRTISEAMKVACAPAGRLLREQVRNMRAFLRERRLQILTVTKKSAAGAAGKVRDVVAGLPNRATGLFRNAQ